MNIKKLIMLNKETEGFLLEYANNAYGQAKVFKITKTVVKKFMLKASESDLKEAHSYIQFKNEMLSQKGSDDEGASDLEDWIKHVLNRNKE